jgi:hypothetical protein
MQTDNFFDENYSINMGKKVVEERKIPHDCRNIKIPFQPKNPIKETKSEILNLKSETNLSLSLFPLLSSSLKLKVPGNRRKYRE